MCHALSAKLAEGKLVVLEDLKLSSAKTSAATAVMKNFEGRSFFVVDGSELNKDFALATRNLHNIVTVPQIGANVYDIVKHDVVMLTKDALTALEARLTNA